MDGEQNKAPTLQGRRLLKFDGVCWAQGRVTENLWWSVGGLSASQPCWWCVQVNLNHRVMLIQTRQDASVILPSTEFHLINARLFLSACISDGGVTLTLTYKDSLFFPFREMLVFNIFIVSFQLFFSHFSAVNICCFPSICWFSLISDGKWRIFGFRTAEWPKQMCRPHCGLWEPVMSPTKKECLKTSVPSAWRQLFAPCFRQVSPL